MGNLETFQKIGESGTEVFDKMDNNEKKEGFSSLIEELDENEKINWLKSKRNSMAEDQKLKLYKMNAVTVGEFLKNGSPLYQIYSAIVNGANNTIKNGGKNALKFAFLERIPCRFLIELGILQKPESLSKEQLIKDIKKDAKNFNTYLSICSTACTCIPEARPAVPFIKMAKPYTKRYQKHGTEVVIARLNEQEKKELTTHTQKELSHVLAA